MPPDTGHLRSPSIFFTPVVVSCTPTAYLDTVTKWPIATLLIALASMPVGAQINAGEQKPEPALPFTMTQAAKFSLPWRIAFLPDGRMLITEKVGPLWLVTQD